MRRRAREAVPARMGPTQARSPSIGLPREDDAMAPQPDELALFQLKVWKYKEGEVVSLMAHLGDRLGLYRSMAGAAPMTAGGLAAATGFHERWLLEWLRGQAAAGLLETGDGERFELSDVAAAVL